MSRNPVLIVYTNMNGNQLFSMSSMKIEDYGNVPSTIRSNLLGITQRLGLDVEENLIKLLINLDETYTIWVHNQRRYELERTALGKYLAKMSFRMALEMGWIPGQQVKSPIILDRMVKKAANVY